MIKISLALGAIALTLGAVDYPLSGFATPEK